VSIDTERGVFYDHVQNCGGGVMALVEIVLNCNRASALAWLESEGFIEPRRLTHEQRREHARRRDEATSAALDIAHWRIAFILELNTCKAAAAQTWNDVALGRAASLCNLLENGSPADVVREFIRQRMADPATVARFVALGQERDEEARRITTRVVHLLARAVGREDFNRAE
jgi:hypothetical protein